MKAYSGMIKLGCLLVLAPLVIWKYGVGSTYSLYSEKQKLEVLNSNSVMPPQEVSAQRASLASSEPLLSNGKFLQLFADSLAAGKVEIISYTPSMIDSEDNYKLYCGKLVLAGGYIELVKVVALMEKAALPLKIASTTYEYDIRKRNASGQILLTLLIEQIEY